MDPYAFDKKFGSKVLEERRHTNEILRLINECSESKSYLYLGYSSLFAWLVNGHGYSESAACRRIEAARLLKAVPEAAKKLETGEISLTQIAKVQTAVRAQEKAIHQKLPAEQKLSAINAVAGKPRMAAEQQLKALFPSAPTETLRDKSVAVDPETIRLSFNVTNDVMNDLTRAKEVLSHAIPSGATGKVLARLLREFLNRKDPMRKQPRSRAGSRVEDGISFGPPIQ